MSKSVLNPNFVNTKMREMLDAVESGRDVIYGDPRPHHVLKDGKKINYVTMLGSAPLTRGNELMLKMVQAIPPECATIIWRNNPELQQNTPFQRAPRILVRMRLALLDEKGNEMKPTQYIIEEGQAPIGIEEYEEGGGYVLQPAN